MSRVDLQVNFQWFIWAPFPDIGKVFSARWTGTLVPDVSVDGSIGVNYDAGSARYLPPPRNNLHTYVGM